MTFRLPVKAYSLVAVPLVFELAFVFTLVFFQGQLESSYSKEIRARRLANIINQGLADCLKAGTYGALSQMGGGKFLLREGRTYIRDLRRVKERLLSLEGLSAVDRQGVESLNASLESILNNFPDPEKNKIKQEANYIMSLHIAVQDLLDEANKILDRQGQIQEIEQAEQLRLRNFINGAVMAGVIFNVILAVALAFLFNRSIISRLEVVLRNSNRLAAGEPLLPRVDGSDEIADLDRVFHNMAAQIEKATEREKALLLNSSDVIFALDSLLEIKVVSGASKRLWYYEPEQLIGQEIDQIIREEDLDKAREALLGLKQENHSRRFEVGIKRKDGTIMDASISAYFAEGEGQIFCVAHDISERKALERQKEEFLSMVSHDLRSPITSLILTFDMFIQGALGELNKNGAALANTSRKDLDRLNRLINDLLDADRLEKGKMEIRKEGISSLELQEMVLQSVAQQGSKRGIEIKSTWPEITINCDKDRIVQVLVNLLNNAIKFSPDDSAIEMNLLLKEGEFLVEVKDRGPGVEASELERIFERFRQVPGTRGGSGLGLAICKALVEAHGGEIGAESEPGEGSRFWFSLPR